MSDCTDVRPGNPIADWARTVAEFARLKRRRKGFKRLLKLEDHMLEDIGVLRSEVIDCASLPLSQDAATELRRISLSRRRRLM